MGDTGLPPCASRPSGRAHGQGRPRGKRSDYLGDGQPGEQKDEQNAEQTPDGHDNATPSTIAPALANQPLPAQRERAEVQDDGQAHAKRDADRHPEEASPTQGPAVLRRRPPSPRTPYPLPPLPGGPTPCFGRASARAPLPSKPGPRPRRPRSPRSYRARRMARGRRARARPAHMLGRILYEPGSGEACGRG